MASEKELVKACLARIEEVDSQVQAWAFLDPEYAIAQARAADQLRLSGQAIGPLHGIPVGVKDIFDTADLPTECGSVLYAGRTPSRDATTVAAIASGGGSYNRQDGDDGVCLFFTGKNSQSA